VIITVKGASATVGCEALAATAFKYGAEALIGR